MRFVRNPYMKGSALYVGPARGLTFVLQLFPQSKRFALFVGPFAWEVNVRGRLLSLHVGRRRNWGE